MAVHTRLSKKDILDLLSIYKIGNLVNFFGIKEGIENTNYKITTTKNSYVLTIFEERVIARDYQDAQKVALARNPGATVVSTTAVFD